MITIPLDSLRLSPSDYSGGGGSESLYYTQFQYGGSRLLFKKYLQGKGSPEVSLTNLEKLVNWPQPNGPRAHSLIFGHCAYPVAAVTEGSRAAGVLIPELNSFFLRQPGLVRDANELARKRELSDTNAPYFPVPYKLTALGVILNVIVELHEIEMVVGDLQPRNIAIGRQGRRLKTRFIDCDSMRVGGVAAISPISPEAWKIRGEEYGFTTATDLAKFSALACRALRDRAGGAATPDDDLLEMISPSHVRQLRQMSELAQLPSRHYFGLARDWQGALEMRPDGVRLYSWPRSTVRQEYPNAASPWSQYVLVHGQGTVGLDLWPPVQQPPIVRTAAPSGPSTVTEQPSGASRAWSWGVAAIVVIVLVVWLTMR